MDFIFIIKTLFNFILTCFFISSIVVRDCCKFFFKFLIFFNNKYNQTKISIRQLHRVPHCPDAVFIMRKWLDQNKECPYASRQDLLSLVQETKLNERQIRLWLTYERKKLRLEKNFETAVPTNMTN